MSIVAGGELSMGLPSFGHLSTRDNIGTVVVLRSQAMRTRACVCVCVCVCVFCSGVPRMWGMLTGLVFATYPPPPPNKMVMSPAFLDCKLYVLLNILYSFMSSGSPEVKSFFFA